MVFCLCYGLVYNEEFVAIKDDKVNVCLCCGRECLFALWTCEKYHDEVTLH